jgi:hypothetical protein
MRKITSWLVICCLGPLLSGCSPSSSALSCEAVASPKNAVWIITGSRVTIRVAVSAAPDDPTVRLFDDLRRRLADSAHLTYASVAIDNRSGELTGVDGISTYESKDATELDRFQQLTSYLGNLFDLNGGTPDANDADQALSDAWQALDANGPVYPGQSRTVFFVTPKPFPGPAHRLFLSLATGSSNCVVR